MVELALLLLFVLALMDGLVKLASKVSITKIKGFCVNSLLIAAAICNPPCANGGSCIAPNVCNCGNGFTDTQSGCTGKNVIRLL